MKAAFALAMLAAMQAIAASYADCFDALSNVSDVCLSGTGVLFDCDAECKASVSMVRELCVTDEAKNLSAAIINPIEHFCEPCNEAFYELSSICLTAFLGDPTALCGGPCAAAYENFPPECQEATPDIAEGFNGLAQARQGCSGCAQAVYKLAVTCALGGDDSDGYGDGEGEGEGEHYGEHEGEHHGEHEGEHHGEHEGEHYGEHEGEHHGRYEGGHRREGSGEGEGEGEGEDDGQFLELLQTVCQPNCIQQIRLAETECAGDPNVDTNFSSVASICGPCSAGFLALLESCADASEQDICSGACHDGLVELAAICAPLSTPSDGYILQYLNSGSSHCTDTMAADCSSASATACLLRCFTCSSSEFTINGDSCISCGVCSQYQHCLSPSAPPAPPATPAISASDVKAKVQVNFIVSIELSQCDAAFKLSMARKLAAKAGISPDDCTITCTAGSVNVAAEMSASSDEIASDIRTTIASTLDSTASATLFLGVPVVSVPEVQVQAPPPPSPPPSSDDGLSVAVIIGIVVGAVLAVIIIIVILVLICKAKKTPAKVHQMSDS